MSIKGALITGGGGFLGSHLAETFLTQNIPVICLDNFATGSPANVAALKSLNTKATFLFFNCDVVNPWPDQIMQAAKECTVSHVFHFASPASPPHYQRLALETMAVNTVGLRRALDFADVHKARLVFASTSEIYGDPAVSPQPETYFGNVNTMGPRSCYDEAKRFGETILHVHNQVQSTRHGLVRIFNTYGPRMNPVDGRVIINMLVQAQRGLPLSVYGDGQQTRSFCYVSDLVEGIIRYAKSDETTPINVGNPNEFTILELVEEIKKLNSSKALKVNFSPLPGDDPKRRCPDLTKARQRLNGWGPTVSLEEGLKKMAEWLQRIDIEKLELPGRPQ